MGWEGVEVVEKIWLPPRDSNPDMLIQSLAAHFVSGHRNKALITYAQVRHRHTLTIC